MVKTIERPVHLNLTAMKFPPMAILSILHRISGVVLFLLLPLVLYLLHASLNPAGFALVHVWIAMPFFKLAVWAWMSALALHWLAGIRHMVMDVGFAESLRAGRLSAYIIMALAGMVIVLLGVWLW